MRLAAASSFYSPSTVPHQKEVMPPNLAASPLNFMAEYATLPPYHHQPFSANFINVSIICSCSAFLVLLLGSFILFHICKKRKKHHCGTELIASGSAEIKVITIDQDPILAHPLHHGHDAVPSSSTVDIFNTNAVPSSSTADIFDTTTNESHAQIPVQRDTSLHNTSTEEIHPSPAEQKEVIDHHESPSLESLKSSQYHSLSPESMLSSAGSSQYGSPSREWALAHSKEDSSS